MVGWGEKFVSTGPIPMGSGLRLPLSKPPRALWYYFTEHYNLSLFWPTAKAQWCVECTCWLGLRRMA